MANIIYRTSDADPARVASSVSPGPLTNAEVDGNFKEIDLDLATKAPINDASLTGTTQIASFTATGTSKVGSGSAGAHALPYLFVGNFSLPAVADAVNGYVSSISTTTGHTLGRGYVSRGQVTAPISFYTHYQVDSVVLNGGTVANQLGYYCADLDVGDVAKGFFGAVSSGTNKWNLYMSGTANNYIKGAVRIGGLSTDSYAAALNVTGNTILTGDLTVTGNVTGFVAGATLSAVAATTTYYIGLSADTTGAWTDARVDSGDLYYTSGDNTLYATNVNTASDARIKDNIETITAATDTVNQLRGVSFNWKETGKKSYGVVAQEVEAILPELVNTIDDKKSVNYTALIGFLIETIKEMDARIIALESK